MRALGKLSLRGAIMLGICAVAALSIACFLCLIATSLQPKKHTTAELTEFRCIGGHCPVRGNARQVLAAKISRGVALPNPVQRRRY